MKNAEKEKNLRQAIELIRRLIDPQFVDRLSIQQLEHLLLSIAIIGRKVNEYVEE